MVAPLADTIFALSSGRPPAAIAVVRISGPRAGQALKALSGKMPSPREAAFARLRHPQTGAPIDDVLVLWFPAPASETGEDVAELQLHGGRAVVAAVLAALGTLEGLRPAEAGEFTRRGFENGKLDLTAVEGLADLVMAETEAQRRQALRHLQGLLGKRAQAWRQKLIEALALVEARIDFSDEGDVPDNLIEPALAIARALESEIAEALADSGRGERLRDGLTVAIAGPPNAGKSTLLNRIARREAAIVSPHAGTTRDVIEVHLDLAGYPVTLLDTAGIRPSDDPVEIEGVRRARERAAAADLVLWVEDATGPVAEAENRPAAPLIWRVRNKIDLLGEKNEPPSSRGGRNEPVSHVSGPLKNMVNQRLTARNESGFRESEPRFDLSAAIGAGFDGLLDALTQFAADQVGGSEAALVTRARHRHALQAADDALRRVLALPAPRPEELVAQELHAAARALDRLTGRIDVEDVLDVIFRDFCIGK